MNIKNTRHFILNRISKRKRQYKNRRSNETRKQDNLEEEKDILK